MSKTIYLLQNETQGYIGDFPVFWAKDGSGYTPDIDNAARFEPRQAAAIIRRTKGSHRWKRWKLQDVLKSMVRVADIEKLRQTTRKPTREITPGPTSVPGTSSVSRKESSDVQVSSSAECSSVAKDR